MTTATAKGPVVWTPERIERHKEATRSDPVGWIEYSLNLRYWSKQIAVAESVRDNRQTVVPSANSTGKTFGLVGGLTCWFLYAFAPAIVIFTSSVWANLRDQIWPKLHRVRGGARFKRFTNYGEIGKMHWVLDGDRWRVVGVSPQQPETAGGYHAEGGILVIVDEASFCGRELIAALRGNMASTPHFRFLMIGNPIRSSGPFFDNAHNPARWKRIDISALDCPSMTGDEPDIPGLATREWVEEQREEYGEQSPEWYCRVLGQFPPQDSLQLIAFEWVEAATLREQPQAGPKTAGIDVARSPAGDFTVVQVCDGDRVFPPAAWQEPNLMVNVERVIDELKAQGVDPENVRIDDVGIGGGMTDRLWQLDWPVVPINVGATAQDPERFANIRAEAAWHLREFIRTRAVLPSDRKNEHVRRMLKDLTTVRLADQTRQRAQLQLEPKATTRDRLGRSPDYFDALMLAKYQPAVQEYWIQPVGQF